MSSSSGGGAGGGQVPSVAVLDTWTSHGWRDGLMVNQLLVHERLTIHTHNSLYEIIVTKPHEAEVLVRGGQFFPEFTPVRVAGCSLGGSFLKVHGIYVGFLIELVTESQTIITSPVKTIAVSRGDGAPIHVM